MRAIFAVVLLASCAPPEHDARWIAGDCIRSHSETRLETVGCGLGINGGYDCGVGRLRYVTHDVCDERGPPICLPGSDGVADCPVDASAE